MDKKAAMKRIIELTHSENWQEDKEIVAEVQKLGKSMWAEKSKRRTPRKIAIWHGDRILVTGTAEQLSEITGLSKNIIWIELGTYGLIQKDDNLGMWRRKNARHENPRLSNYQ